MMYTIMPSKSELFKMKKMCQIIKKFGYIGRTEFQTECGNMSTSTYNRLKPYFDELYVDTGKVGYDKQKKIWYDMNPGEKSVEEEIQRCLTDN